MIFFFDSGFMILCVFLLLVLLFCGISVVNVIAEWIFAHFWIVSLILIIKSIMYVKAKTLRGFLYKTVATCFDAIRSSLYFWVMLDGIRTIIEHFLSNIWFAVFEFIGFVIAATIFSIVSYAPLRIGNDNSQYCDSLLLREFLCIVAEIICCIIIYKGFKGW